MRTALVLAFSLVGLARVASAADSSDLATRLERLEQRQMQLEHELADRDTRIRALERRLGAGGDRATAAFADAPSFQPAAAVSVQTVAADAAPSPPSPVPLASASREPDDSYGEFQPGGRGFRLADTPFGTVNFSAWSYLRYLNQKQLDPTYTDAFGRTRNLDLRNDLQLSKVNLYFKGWVFDPKFHYLLYTWSANTNQGDSAQVVVAGDLGWRFSDSVDLGFGIQALPGVRSLTGTFPVFNKVDSRTIADDFFRPSYTTGVFASGKLEHDVQYKVMLGNNLSQLGVNAAQLDAGFNTLSAAVWWTPATGEFGANGGYGDFEYHDELATSFGMHVTRSREDRQSQPSTESIENSQIRLSDGTLLFQPGAFGTDGRINKATYLMAALDAGMKYRGFALEGSLYFRHLDDFDVEGVIPVTELDDQGFEVQASMMVVPKKLQTYLAYSKVNGDYGDPYDVSLGLNWYPLGQRLMRVNTELQYFKNSPVGSSATPYIVGANGTLAHVDLEIMF